MQWYKPVTRQDLDTFRNAFEKFHSVVNDDEMSYIHARNKLLQAHRQFDIFSTSERKHMCDLAKRKLQTMYDPLIQQLKREELINIKNDLDFSRKRDVHLYNYELLVNNVPAKRAVNTQKLLNLLEQSGLKWDYQNGEVLIPEVGTIKGSNIMSIIEYLQQNTSIRSRLTIPTGLLEMFTFILMNGIEDLIIKPSINEPILFERYQTILRIRGKNADGNKKFKKKQLQEMIKNLLLLNGIFPGSEKFEAINVNMQKSKTI